ncbi:MAG: hypothetical protein ACE10G_06285 [Gemmatimonadales bacterium]
MVVGADLAIGCQETNVLVIDDVTVIPLDGTAPPCQPNSPQPMSSARV